MTMNLYKMCYHFERDGKDYCFVSFQMAETAKEAAEIFRRQERESVSYPKRVLESVKLVKKGERNG